MTVANGSDLGDDAGEIGKRLSATFANADVGVFRVLCQIGRGDL